VFYELKWVVSTTDDVPKRIESECVWVPKRVFRMAIDKRIGCECVWVSKRENLAPKRRVDDKAKPWWPKTWPQKGKASRRQS
jgi:hypothetical protein